jgi:hypothetical protein
VEINFELLQLGDLGLQGHLDIVPEGSDLFIELVVELFG